MPATDLRGVQTPISFSAGEMDRFCTGLNEPSFLLLRQKKWVFYAPIALINGTSPKDLHRALQASAASTSWKSLCFLSISFY